eukprot:5371154-Prymnesium_polylepis.1
MPRMTVSSCPNQQLALTNQIFLNPADMALLGEGEVFLELNGVLYSAAASPQVEAGNVALNSIQRRGAGVSNGDAVEVSLFNVGADNHALSECVFEVDFVVKTKARGPEPVDAVKLSAAILARFPRQFFRTGQTVAIEFHGDNYLLKAGRLQVMTVDSSSGGAVDRGMLVAQTEVVLQKGPGSL